jgi:hypothetical protein
MSSTDNFSTTPFIRALLVPARAPDWKSAAAHGAAPADSEGFRP